MTPPNRMVPQEQLGCPTASAGASLPVAPGKPVTRCLEAAPPLVAPVARCSSLRSVLLNSSPRLPGARRFGAWLLAPPESPPPREPEPFSPPLGPKALLGGLGHPVPVGVRSPVRRIPSRMDNPRSRGIFESPGLSPNFFFNPQKCSRRPPFMHRDVPRSTGVSSGFVDGWTVIRLNGRRWRSSMSPTRPPSRSSRSRSLRRARGVPTCSSSRPRAAFLLPVSGHRPKEK